MKITSTILRLGDDTYVNHSMRETALRNIQSQFDLQTETLNLYSRKAALGRPPYDISPQLEDWYRRAAEETVIDIIKALSRGAEHQALEVTVDEVFEILAPAVDEVGKRLTYRERFNNLHLKSKCYDPDFHPFREAEQWWKKRFSAESTQPLVP